MKRVQGGWILIASSVLLTGIAVAEPVPYSVSSVRAVVQSGFVKLLGPGEINVQGRAERYRGQLFVNVANIASMAAGSGSGSSCVLRYSTPNYRENIVVQGQSCEQVLQQFALAMGR